MKKAVPVFEERAMTMGDTLVVADLHIGIEDELRKKGVYVPSQANAIKEKLRSLLDKSGCKELILLGDVKHSIPSLTIQEHWEIPLLIDELNDAAEVRIVKGNHDGGLEKLVPGFEIMDYIHRRGTIYLHGHSWIKVNEIKADLVVLAHLHPAVAFVDDFKGTVKEPIWIKGNFTKKLKDHYEVSRSPNFIVMPAFNPLIYGMAVNKPWRERGQLGPWMRSGVLDMKSAHAYLLDGTDLGRISDLKAA